MLKTITAGAFIFLILLISVSAQAKVIKVPKDFATIQAAVDNANNGDTIRVAPGMYAGAEISTRVNLIGEGYPVINSGPILFAGFIDAGFFIDAGGSGTTIKGFTFDGTDFPANEATTVGFAVFTRQADDVSVTHCKILGTIQGVTNTWGSGWLVSHNQFIEVGTLAFGGGIGIVMQTRDPNSNGRVTDSMVNFNHITGVSGTAVGFSTAGIVLLGTDDSIVKNNDIEVTDTNGDSIGIIVDNRCCGIGGTIADASTGSYISNNDMRGSDLGLFVGNDNGASDNTAGLVMRGNFGTNQVGDGEPVISILNRSIFTACEETDCP